MRPLSFYQGLLSENYHLLRPLAEGGFGLTFLAESASGQTCVMKMLSLKQAENWKSVELFDREAELLQHLKHSGIPRYYDHFSVEADGENWFFLVQEYVSGQSLLEWIQSGRRFQEAEAIDIARQLAEILDYLHSFSPPIIHRDIKPSNVMLDDRGQVHLIDFGAVRDTLLPAGNRGSTIVGTFGYMPLEQYEGRAQPASDLYGLGMTMLYLLTGIEPVNMKKRGLSIDYAGYLTVSKGLSRLVGRLIEQDLERRYRHAKDLQFDLLKLQRKHGDQPLFSKVFRRSKKSLEHLPAWLPLALGCLLIFGVILTLSVRDRQNHPPPQPVKAQATETVSEISEWPAPWQPLLGQYSKSEYLNEFPKTIGFDAQGNQWLLTGQRIYQRSPERDNPDSSSVFWELDQLSDKKFTFSELKTVGDVVYLMGHDKDQRDLIAYHQQSWQHLTLPETGKANILGSHQGQLLVGIGRTLWAYDATKKHWHSLVQLPESTKAIQAVTSDGTTLWLSDYLQVWSFRQSLNKVWRSSDLIKHLLITSDQALWIGTSKGLKVYWPAQNREQSFLDKREIAGIQQDKQGRIWVSSHHQGIFVQDSPHDPKANWLNWGWREGLPDKEVQDLQIDNQGQVWLILGHSISTLRPHFAKADTVIQTIQNRATLEQIPAQIYDSLCLAVKAKGIGSLAGGISAQISTTSLSGKALSFMQGQQRCPAGSNYYSPQQTLVYDDYQNGLTVRKPEQIYRIGKPPVKGYLSIDKIFIDNKQRIWISTSQGNFYFDQQWHKVNAEGQMRFAESKQGIFMGKYTGKGTMLQHFQKGSLIDISPVKESYPPSIYAMASYGDQQIALASTEGLWYGDPQHLQQVNAESGLAYNMVMSLSATEKGIWLLLYNRGLAYFDLQDQSLKHWTTREGLFSDRLQHVALDAEGRLWLEDADQRVAVYQVTDLMK